jgi:hypothetical protein
MAGSEQMIIELDKQRMTAMAQKDVAALSVNSKGKSNSFRVRFTDVYENQNGTWRMITWQSTKLPE